MEPRGTLPIATILKEVYEVDNWKQGTNYIRSTAINFACWILPLPMLRQMSDVLLLCNLVLDKNDLNLPNVPMNTGRCSEIFNLPKTRTENARSEFCYRICGWANQQVCWHHKVVWIRPGVGPSTWRRNALIPNFLGSQLLHMAAILAATCAETSGHYFRSNYWNRMRPALQLCAAKPKQEAFDYSK